MSAENAVTPRAVDVRRLRKSLSLSQTEFAARFGLNLSTLRSWEQRRGSPDESARAFLTVIARIPDVVAEALAG